MRLAIPGYAFCSCMTNGTPHATDARHTGSETYPPVPTTTSGLSRVINAMQWTMAYANFAGTNTLDHESTCYRQTTASVELPIRNS